MTKSETMFKKALKILPGGVNSPVRAFKSVNSTPLFIKKAHGSHITDIDGNTYIDYVGSWGPMILGHAYPEVINAIQKTASNGTSFGAPIEMEIELAEMVINMVPGVEMVRFVNSGTEAVTAAIRLARAYSNRQKIIKFAGCYHGAVDSLLIQAGSGVATLGLPDSPGIPQEVTGNTIILEFNDFSAIKEAFKLYKDDLAAVIVEPVIGNSGCILPEDGYLELLRELTASNNTLLIFDEVMTGFRLSPGGAQQLYNIIPDLTTMGKIIGGGLPVGAYGGKKDIMKQIAPAGPVYQAGTLSGNPLAMAAGIATLKALKELNPYDQLEKSTSYLCKNFADIAKKSEIDISINHKGSMFSVFFTREKVIDFTSAKSSNLQKFTLHFKNMLANEIYLPPAQFEANFLSLAHTSQDLNRTIEAFEKSMSNLKNL
jgi:glutamate-1-semialdehyde 2,1-aminomutase